LLDGTAKSGGKVCARSIYGGVGSGVGVEEAGEFEGGGGGETSDEDGLEGAFEDVGAESAALGAAEEGEGDEGDEDGDVEGGGDVGEEDVGGERDGAAGDVGEGNGEGGAEGAAGGGLFEAELETHHEVDVGFGIGLEGVEDGRGGFVGDAVVLEDLVDFGGFVLGALDDFELFAAALGGEVLGIAAGGEVAAEAHGDGAGGDFGEAGGDDEAGGGDGSGKTGGEGEGDGEAVGQADDEVAHHLGGVEVDLVMGVSGPVRGGGCFGWHSESVEG
jgi:hypothetical protein